MPKKPRLLPVADVVRMASDEGVSIHRKTLSRMVKDGKIPGAKKGKHGGRGIGSKHWIPEDRAKEIVGNLKRRKELLETHVTVDQILKQARETRVRVPGQKGERRLRTTRVFIGDLCRREIVKGAVKDPTSLYKSIKLMRWLIPKGQVNEVMFRILQLNAPRISGHLTIQGVVGNARRQGVEIHPTTINQMLNNRKYGEKYRMVLGAAQFLGEGRRPANWLISPEGSRRIIASARVKKPAFMRATADMPVEEVESLAKSIEEAMRSGAYLTAAKAARELRISTSTLYTRKGVPWETYASQRFLKDAAVQKLKVAIGRERLRRPRRRK